MHEALCKNPLVHLQLLKGLFFGPIRRVRSHELRTTLRPGLGFKVLGASCLCVGFSAAPSPLDIVISISGHRWRLVFFPGVL